MGNMNMKETKEIREIIEAVQKGDLETLQSINNKEAQDNDDESLDLRSIKVDGENLLHMAIKKGNQEVVEYLISKGMSVVEEDVFGYPPLLIAAFYGHTKLFQYLHTKAGCSLTDKDPRENPALLVAAEKGHRELVNYLLKNKLAEISECNKEGYNVLAMACISGNNLLIEDLINHYGLHPNQQKQFLNGANLLMLAAEAGHFDTLKLLIKLGCHQFHETNTLGDTVLMIAARANQFNIVEYLIKNKYSKSNERDSGGCTILLYAAQFGQNDMIDFLIENGYSTFDEKDNQENNALLFAANKGKINTVIHLLKKYKLDPKSANCLGNTMIHMAATANQVAMFDYLLKNNLATLNDKTKHGLNAAYAAAYCGSISILNYLYEKEGLSIFELDENGDHLLGIATERGHLEAIKFLIKCGAYVDLKNKKGLTAVKIAWNRPHHCMGREKVIRVLEAARRMVYGELGAERDNSTDDSDGDNTTDSQVKVLGDALNARRAADGNTGLHFAIQKGDEAAVKMLLDRAARLDIPNKKGETAWDLAVKCDNTDIKLMMGIRMIFELSGKLLNSKENKEAMQKLLDSVVESTYQFTQDKSLKLKDKRLRILFANVITLPAKPQFRPVEGCNLLLEVSEKYVKDYPIANYRIFELLMGGHVRIQYKPDGKPAAVPVGSVVKDNKFTLKSIDEDLEDETHSDAIETAARLRNQIKYFLLSGCEEIDLINKLIAQYSLGNEESMKGINLFTLKNVELQLLLMDKLREQSIEIARLKNQLAVLNNKVEANPLLPQFKNLSDGKGNDADVSKLSASSPNTSHSNSRNLNASNLNKPKIIFSLCAPK